MAQLSRPFQIGLVGVVLLAAVWVLALRGHSSSSSPSSPAPASASTHRASPSTHASAPGVAGLSRAVSKAHEAVATSEKNASQLEKKSEQASSTSAPATQSATPTHAASKPSATSSASKSASRSSAAAPAHSSGPARQRAAEAALKKGDVVVLLFWDKHGTDDVAVHRAVQSLKGARKLFTSQAPANQVASYGSITRGIQVYGTPTVLIVNSKGKTITLTGLQDAYSIRQAIAEARS